MAKEMHTFSVPVYYEMRDIVYVDAPVGASREKLCEMALEQFRKEPLDLQEDDYIPDSEDTDENDIIYDLTDGSDYEEEDQ